MVPVWRFVWLFSSNFACHPRHLISKLEWRSCVRDLWSFCFRHSGNNLNDVTRWWSMSRHNFAKQKWTSRKPNFIQCLEYLLFVSPFLRLEKASVAPFLKKNHVKKVSQKCHKNGPKKIPCSNINLTWEGDWPNPSPPVMVAPPLYFFFKKIYLFKKLYIYIFATKLKKKKKAKFKW